MLHCTIDGEAYPIQLNTDQQGKIDPIDWLQSQPLYPKVFWKEKHDDTIRAAVGSTFLFPRIPSIAKGTDPEIRLYGGMRFDSRATSSIWTSFPQTLFWLPQIEMTCRGSNTEIRSYGPEHELKPTSLKQTRPPSCYYKSNLPDVAEWEKQVEITLQAIKSQQINKLVLARQTTLECDTPLSPLALVADLLAQNTQSTLFAFQMSPSVCFLGATPEMLFKREGCWLTTEAIAGTRSRGSTSDEEKQLERELLLSEKDRREFNFVKNALETSLLPLATTGGWEGKDRVIKTTHLQHLYNRLRIKPKTNLSDAELIALLHPTPALGGHPKQEALFLLKQLEPFDRGWYGAPIGVISSQSSAFYVAIRSALIKEKQIHLFAGLGLVEGSCPKKEWEELDAKIGWFKPDWRPS